MNPGKGNAQVAGCAGMIVMLVVIYIGVEVSDTFSGLPVDHWPGNARDHDNGIVGAHETFRGRRRAAA